jgi:hypothetical protein
MTTNPTPTTHAAKAEAARQAARSSGLGSPAAMYFLGIAQTHALLEVAEQLRIRNLIALANGLLPERILDDSGSADIQASATKALVDIETHAVDVGLPDVPGEYVTAQLRPDIAATLGVQS